MSSPIRQSFTDAWRQHRLLLRAGGVYSLVSIIYILWAGTPPLEMKTVLGSMGVSCLVAYAFMGGAYGWIVLKKVFCEWRARRFRRSVHAGFAHANKLASDYVETPAFAKAMVGVVTLLPINFSIAYKSLIPFVNNFRWDPLLAKLDRAVHFGHYPQEWVVPFVDALHGGRFMNLCYNAWFVFFLTAMGYALFLDGDDRRRLSFLWTFLLLWIFGGSLMATWLSSVGPVFFHAFYPAQPDIYDGLLGDTGSSSFILGKLVEWTLNSKHIDANGISAMPSMHLAVAALVTIYYSRFNLCAFLPALLFSLCIFTATVYTGLHYAIDGYVGILLAALSWAAADRLAGRALEKRENP
ncbi:MAG: hypothetical protein GC185_00135 [Alphaproteobacteria bacterium]|nr:hypothetical protein [Alphaproteobacteria bacterium]